MTFRTLPARSTSQCTYFVTERRRDRVYFINEEELVLLVLYMLACFLRIYKLEVKRRAIFFISGSLCVNNPKKKDSRSRRNGSIPLKFLGEKFIG